MSPSTTATLAGADCDHHHLTERALRLLIKNHGHSIALVEMPWLSGVLSMVRQGFPLTTEQVARVSHIRGRLARAYHRRGGPPQIPQWDGAA